MNELKKIEDTLRLLKYSPPKPVFCPKCNGSNIFSESIIGLLPSLYHCKDCGYSGPVILELDENEEHSYLPK